MSGPQTQFYPQQYPPYPGAQMGYPARPEGWAPPPNYEMNQVPLNPPPPANLQYHRPYDEREVFWKRKIDLIKKIETIAFEYVQWDIWAIDAFGK